MIVVLSGPIAVGKSTLSTGLQEKGFAHVSTRAFLKSKAGSGASREEMQKLGAALDLEHPDWFVDLVSTHEADFLVVDSARRGWQIQAVRDVFGANNVLHVHLEADDRELIERFEARHEGGMYSAATNDEIEQHVRDLRSEADIVINTSECGIADTLIRVLARIGWGRFTTPTVDVLVGGQYGSEGKGHVVAHIAPEYQALIRVGGPNAGHSVLYNGNHLSFYHLPSGVLHSPQASLIFGAAMNIRIPVLMAEIEKAEALGVPVRSRLGIDSNANVITDDDIRDELGLVQGIGSTGQGVGYATAGKIRDRGRRKVAKDYEELRPFICDAQDELQDLYVDESKILLEGTQGTGLSLYHGPYPHVTSRDTTVSGTLGDAGIPVRRVRKVVMVVRTNPIRVQSPVDGTSGPMSREISWKDVSWRSGVPEDVLREREKTTTTKRQRRVSEFDWSLLARSVQLNAPTDIALTFADYMSPKNKDARRFEQLTPETLALIHEIEAVAHAPVSLITTRLHERSIIDRRRGW